MYASTVRTRNVLVYSLCYLSIVLMRLRNVMICLINYKKLVDRLQIKVRG